MNPAVDSASASASASSCASPVEAAPAHIRGLPPYVPGRPPSDVLGDAGRVCMMASNENPLGASPRAVAAMQAAAAQAAQYPDPHGEALKAALGRRFGVDTDRLLLGNGSSELIDLVARTFLRPGDEAVHSQYAFIAYPLAIRLANATPVMVPAREHGHDLDAMAAAITPRTRLVFIANPNNPTGTRLDEARLRAFLARVPAHVAVLLDEAYTEYQAPGERVDALGLVDEFPQLVLARTFSKAYGLAGLRVGYAVAQPTMAELLNRARPVFNVNALAQAAAVAALSDSAFLDETFRVNREGMAQLEQAFDRLGLPRIPSSGNFIAADFSGHPLGAAQVFQRLLRAGFVVRPLAAYGLPDHLRVTIGTAPQNRDFIAALEAVLAAAPQAGHAA